MGMVQKHVVIICLLISVKLKKFNSHVKKKCTVLPGGHRRLFVVALHRNEECCEVLRMYSRELRSTLHFNTKDESVKRKPIYKINVRIAIFNFKSTGFFHRIKRVIEKRQKRTNFI